MRNAKTNTMETLTLDQMINSNFINDLIIQDDKDLSETGWTYEEVKQIVKIVTSK
tara:strand:- start:374 stop:538 length:165 start_codon:yes stop_codon:yes gene_type:complete